VKPKTTLLATKLDHRENTKTSFGAILRIFDKCISQTSN